MTAYVTLGAQDFDRSTAFYDAALAPIGWSGRTDYPGWRSYTEDGVDNGLSVLICTPFNGAPASPGNGAMIGFMAKSPAEVDAFYEAAIAQGGSDEGAPGPRPHYGPDWYSAYVRDPAGNKIAVVFNG